MPFMTYGVFLYLLLSYFGVSCQLCHVEPLAPLNFVCFVNKLHYHWLRIFVLLFFGELSFPSVLPICLLFLFKPPYTITFNWYICSLHRILFLLTSTLLLTVKHSIYLYFKINILYCTLEEPWKVCNRCFMNICKVTLKIILNINILSMCTNTFT